MTLQEIKASGLLELYALGEISNEDRIIIDEAIQQYPELAQELNDISQALEVYARSTSIQPSADLKNKILDSVKNSNTKSPTDNIGKSSKSGGGNVPGIGWILALFGLFTALFIYSIYQQNSISEMREELQLADNRCDSIINQQELELEVLRELKSPQNQIYAFSSTGNFERTNLTLFSNSEQEKNYLKINELPAITEDQAFQLWSLKEGIDPIPLTVFTGRDGFIIPVDFEQGTGTYAITIEPKGGSQSPTLSNLIATVTVA